MLLGSLFCRVPGVDRSRVLIKVAGLLISASNLNFGHLLKPLRHIPHIMDELGWHVSQLWYPRFDVLTIRVEFLTLKQRIEEIYAAWPQTCDRTPATVVAPHVVVNQHLFEPVSAVPPI